VTDSEVDTHRYHRRQLLLGVASTLATGAVLVAWIWTGAATALAESLARAPGGRITVVAGMAAAVAGGSAVLTFPLDVLRGFVLPRRAGLLIQPFRGWLADRAKAAALAGGLTLGVLEAVYAFLAASPSLWWLWSLAVLAAGTVALVAVVPVWIVPLFYRLAPVSDPALRERILCLAARVGVTATEVAVAELSRKGRGANAAVVGLGRTRRILVSDTLLSSFPADEVDVVLAHELAHHARGHLHQGLVVQIGLLAVVLALTDRALHVGAPALGLGEPADPAGVPLLLLLLGAFGLATTPLAAAWSRRLEREADGVALAVTQTPGAFVAAMERLGALNLAERRPNRLKELLFATHPSLEQRISLAREVERQLELRHLPSGGLAAAIEGGASGGSSKTPPSSLAGAA
jgi:STE24 endopeptidase